MQPQTASIAVVILCIALTLLMYRLGTLAGALAATNGVPHRAAESMTAGPMTAGPPWFE